MKTQQTYTDAQKLFALDALIAAGDVGAERLAQAVAIYDTCQAARSVVVSDEDALVVHHPAPHAAPQAVPSKTHTVHLAQSHGVAGAVKVPDGLRMASEYIQKKADAYAEENCSTEWDTGAITYNSGSSGMEYHHALLELSDEIASLADLLGNAATQEKAS